MLTHPDLDGRLSLDRTGKPRQLAHGDFISTLGHRAEISSLAVSSVRRSTYDLESNARHHTRRSAPVASVVVTARDAGANSFIPHPSSLILGFHAPAAPVQRVGHRC